MMIISFALTREAFIKRKKIATRRFWSNKYMEMWWNRVSGHDHNYAIAYDKNPRNGGKKIGKIFVKRKPWRQDISKITRKDLIEEGDLWYDENEFRELLLYMKKGRRPFVIKFEPIPDNKVVAKEIGKYIKKYPGTSEKDIVKEFNISYDLARTLVNTLVIEKKIITLPKPKIDDKETEL